MAELRASVRAEAAPTVEEAPSALSDQTQEPSSLERLLEHVATPVENANAVLPQPLPEPARIALLLGLRWVNEHEVEVTLRTGRASFPATVAAEVDRGLVTQAIADRQLLLAEWPEGGTPLIVGVVHTRPPSKLHFSADEIELNASRELVLRSGSAALRLRAGGDVELVGSRISAISSGVMRLIGRLLRLN